MKLKFILVNDMSISRAYAYIRFSTSKQKEGDSLRRQLEACHKYCYDNKLILDEREFKDFGKSAYKKENIQKGSALSVFLSLVESGEIPSGSYLLIESIDRLSRADIYSALMLFGSILNKGIKIVETSKNQVYTPETLTQLGPMLAIMSDTLRSYDESRMKSVRSSANWTQRQKNAIDFAKPITRECPRWLRVSKDGNSYEVLPKMVESINLVFKMRASGLGAQSIASRCNEQKLPAPAKGEDWHISLVNRLIRNRALIGEYQPHKVNEQGVREPYGDPVKAYYPRVIALELFDSVQQINKQSKEFPKRRDINYRNFLQGILYCSCGSRLHRKVKSPRVLDYSRYYCSKRIIGANKCVSIACRDIENAVIWFMSEKAPGLLQFDDFSQSLRTEESVAKSKIEEIDVKIQRLYNFIETVDDEKLTYESVERLKKLKSEKELQTKIAARLIAEASDSAVYWGIKADASFLKAVRDNDAEKLSALRFHIFRIIERIDLSNDANEISILMKNKEVINLVINKNYFDS